MNIWLRLLYAIVVSLAVTAVLQYFVLRKFVDRNFRTSRRFIFNYQIWVIFEFFFLLHSRFLRSKLYVKISVVVLCKNWNILLFFGHLIVFNFISTNRFQLATAGCLDRLLRRLRSLRLIGFALAAADFAALRL